MKVYTYSEARRRLSRVLDEARAYGESRIKRQDGSEFIIQPVKKKGSPLDVKGIRTKASTEDIQSAIRDGRERHYGSESGE
jgi:antitoxin Phd